ncbi:MAG: primosomal protein N' [Lachnospiraceae bacterium]|nr:primosomal protein N' [Lachnospiraceae bacterium]
MFANVIVDISHEKLDRPFQYRIPEALKDEVSIGSCVEIPFGKADKKITGYVIEITDIPCMEMSKIKEITKIKKGSLRIESQLIALAWFIKERYGSTMNKALKTVIPVKQSVKTKEKKYLRLKVSKEEALDLYEEYKKRKNTSVRAELIKELTIAQELEYEEAKLKLSASDAVIKGLVSSNIIELVRTAVYRNPVQDYGETDFCITLNEEQKSITSDIICDIDKGNHHTHLIFGVTGSGKTEVYMEIIKHVIDLGGEAIVLIPEIALTYQTIKRFYNRFGSVVSIINSKLSKGEKFDQFKRAENGEIKVMIGPRSALFTPFKNLRLIIIDEEHEGAYKSDQVPKYHARETAIKRAELAGASVVLGSATPSVHTYYKALNGEYMLHRLNTRANKMTMPKVDIIDMRDELRNGNRDILSGKLKELISDRLAKKEQTILFINRRGYSSFVSCRSCGKPIKCPHCDVSLTLHKRVGGDKLICHYCGYMINMPKACLVCNSKYIGRFGIGTEQVEERILEMFPEAGILRMDMDTTRKKGGYETILSSFANREADILIGTQMIVKGHDFPFVSLVGIIAADLSLFSSDYMASERTFELLTQAAGRAGRGKVEGEVVIQTYNPEEACILSAAKQDYEEFYQNEISYRSLMTYPPVYDMMAILITDKQEDFAERVTKDIADRIKKSNIEELIIIGPSKAAVSKINDVYRNVIYLKHRDDDVLIRVKNAIQRYVDMVEEYRNLSIQFDLNPMTNY